jgi:hypothetical protein
MFRDLAAAASLAGVGWLIYRMETIMANFDALNQKLDQEAAARTAAQERVNESLQALRDEIANLELDTEDQAKVDAAAARVQDNVDAWNAFEPVQVGADGEPTGGEAGAGEAPTEETPAGPAAETATDQV